MGDQEFETQRSFLHKDPNNGSQDIFSLTLLLYALYFLSAIPSTFLSWKKEELGDLMKLEMLALVVHYNLIYTNFFLSV